MTEAIPEIGVAIGTAQAAATTHGSAKERTRAAGNAAFAGGVASAGGVGIASYCSNLAQPFLAGGCYIGAGAFAVGAEIGVNAALEDYEKSQYNPYNEQCAYGPAGLKVCIP